MSRRRSPFTAKPKSNKLPETRDHREIAMTRAIDTLSEFEEFQTDVLPVLRQLIKSKATTGEMVETARPLLVAMLTSMAFSNEDDKLRAQIAKDLIQMIDGKPTEKKEFTHKLGKLKDEEVDALLLTKLREVNGEETD